MHETSQRYLCLGFGKDEFTIANNVYVAGVRYVHMKTKLQTGLVMKVSLYLKNKKKRENFCVEQIKSLVSSHADIKGRALGTKSVPMHAS